MSSSVIFCNFIHNFLIILSEATIKERMTEQLPAFFQITTFPCARSALRMAFLKNLTLTGTIPRTNFRIFYIPLQSDGALSALSTPEKEASDEK